MDLIRLANDDAINAACEHLTRGRLVAIPTETVYGLAANAWDADAVAKIFVAKGRPSSNPLIVHVASIDDLDRAVALPLLSGVQSQLDAIADLWPGPLTVVLPASKRIPTQVTAGLSTVAIRVPSHPVAQELLRRCPFPIAAPSANRSKYVSPTTAAHCCGGLSGHLAMVLDGGPCDLGLESTIVRLSDDGPRLLRPGSVAAESLAARLNISLDELMPAMNPPDHEPSELSAPGMMREHYSPQTCLRLIDDARIEPLATKAGRIAFKQLSADEASRYTIVETLSENGDLSEVSRKLFAAIRRLDGAELDLIIVDVCEPIGLGRAIMDRLRRAAAGHRSD